jgi:DNA-binding transcriptional regulator YiaG
MKDKASIQRKWEKKVEEMKKKAEFKYKLELQKKQNQWKKDFEYLTIKVNKKRDAYISKKEKEYHKRMLNEIREMEGKEVKPIKKKKNLNLMDFSAKIMQENSRLRDSDADGVGYCISCDIKCSWENHQ